MKTIILSATFLGLGMILSGCGTVSQVTPTPGKTVDLSKYDRVLVLDFADGVTAKARPSAQVKKKAEMAVRTKSFPDWIASELGGKNVFKEVTRTGNPDPQTLVISGTITRYTEGDAVGRLMIGFGAWSSYFDATVDFKDGGTSDIIATQLVDKNSWVLGGGIAATQTPEGFMKEAAKKLAEDISIAKTTGKFPEPPSGRPPARTGHR